MSQSPISSPSSLKGLAAQRKAVLEEIELLKGKLRQLNDKYTEIVRLEQQQKRREESPVNRNHLLLELIDRGKPKPRRSMPIKPIPDCENPYLEKFSNLRLRSLLLDTKTWESRMENRRLVKICDIDNLVIDNDIDGDFVLIILFFSQQLIQTEKGDILVLVGTDLRQNYVRVFVIESALKCNYEIGSVFAILNPKLIIPTKKSGIIGLVVSSSKLIIKLGMSVDYGHCATSNGTCNEILNIRKERYCDSHRLELYQQSRLKRQEFVGGTSGVQQGAPPNKLQQSIKRELKSTCYYQIKKTVLICNGLSAQAQQKLKPTSQLASAKEIETLKKLHIPAAENIRLHFGQEKEQCDVNVFGPEALARMGFNPFNPDEIVPTSRSTPKKEAPTTPCKSNLSKNSRKRLDDSSDVELEILGSPTKKPKRLSLNAK